MESVSLYSEARNEYLKQLATWIVPPLVEFFRSQFSEISAKEGKKAMTQFQSWCSEIPRWNQDIIDSNINKLLDSCRCDYIEELMTAVFIAHTKMLTAIRVSSKQKKLQITLPKLDHFLHRIFVECARSFWKAPFLFLDDLSAIEKQKNVLQAEVMCTESLSSAVRSLLPIKSILRDYLEEDEETPATPIPQPEERRKKKKRQESESDSDSSSESSDDSESEEEIKPKKSKKRGGESYVEPVLTPIVSSETVSASTAPTSAPAPVQVQEISSDFLVEEPSFINTVSDTKVFESPPIQPLTEKVAEAPFLEKVVSESESASAINAEPLPELNIETEPSVRFSNYETVFYTNKPDVNEIRYAPKLSIEEMPEKQELQPISGGNWFDENEEDNLPNPKIQVNADSEQTLTLDDVEDLEPPAPAQQIDIETTLASETLDFEELS